MLRKHHKAEFFHFLQDNIPFVKNIYLTFLFNIVQTVFLRGKTPSYVDIFFGEVYMKNPVIYLQ